MQYRTLGTSDLSASVLTLGCWAFAGDSNWGPQEDAESIATVHAALDKGINCFDTAEGYGAGRSEEVLGKALVGRRDEALIASKVSRSNLSPEDIIAACERSLKRLKTDVIDLYQIHYPSRNIPFSDSMGALEKLKEQGKIRAIGISNFGPMDMADLVAVGHVETNQLPYSLLARGIEYEIVPDCLRHGMSILCYMPLMQGLLAGKFATADDVPEGRARTRHYDANKRSGARHGERGCEAETFAAIEKVRQISAELGESMVTVSLAWAMQQPAVATVLVGGRKPEQVAQNALAVDLVLSEETIAQLNAVTEPVKQALGKNPDLFQGGENSRYS